MENKKAPIFALRISAIIIGVTLYKQFDFTTLKFENTALGVVYLLTLAFIVYVLIKDAMKK
jgi:hypothetical protein